MPRCFLPILLVALIFLNAACKNKPVQRVPLPPQLPPPARSEPEPAPAAEPLPEAPPIAEEQEPVPPSISISGRPDLPPPPEPGAGPAPEAPPAPSLAPELSPEQRRLYLRQVAASLARAHRYLAELSGDSLDAGQQQRRNRVRRFIEQAEALRSTDLGTARGLARRAEILARELASGAH